ncbi:MAG: hypothetical protein ABH871_04350 [Pseudomonadota bacterium]
MQIDNKQIEVVDDAMAMILKAKTPLERLNIANGILRSARTLMAASLRVQHPEWDNDEIVREVSKRFLNGTH